MGDLNRKLKCGWVSTGRVCGVERSVAEPPVPETIQWDVTTKSLSFCHRPGSEPCNYGEAGTSPCRGLGRFGFVPLDATENQASRLERLLGSGLFIPNSAPGSGIACRAVAAAVSAYMDGLF